jgi:heme oxygenase
MGDMYGGQMIKKILNIDSPSLTFENRATLIDRLEQKLDIDLVKEANIAFEWAYKILNSYDNEIT